MMIDDEETNGTDNEMEKNKTRKKMMISTKNYNDRNNTSNAFLPNYFFKSPQLSMPTPFSQITTNSFLSASTICRHFSSSSSSSFTSRSSPPLPLTHLDPHSGAARMVDTGAKVPSQERCALARAVVQFPAGVLSGMLAAPNPKGDMFAVARISGILAAKSVPQLIPLCHQISLTSVRVHFRVDEARGRIIVFCRAKAMEARTGVEMEAMVGCSLAALTLYDMTKSATLGIRVQSVQLLGKKGGKRDFGQTEMEEQEETD